MGSKQICFLPIGQKYYQNKKQFLIKLAQGSKEHTIKMQFTGKNTLLLPQVKNFSFSINGIKLSDTGVVKFSIGDTGQNLINFIYIFKIHLDNYTKY